MNRGELFFSIVIPLYNAEKTISRAIKSVLAQKVQGFELLIVNDGSSDNSVRKVQNFNDPRIRLFSQENLGVSSARNKGICESKADLIAFLDADDEWQPDFLLTISQLINKYPECGLFASNYWFKKADSCEPSTVIYPIDWQGIMPDYFHDLLYGHPITASSVVVRKAMIDQIQGFPVNIHFGEDENTWMRLSLITKFAYINKPLSIYHREIPSVTDNKRKNYTGVQHRHSDFLETILKEGKLSPARHLAAVELLARYYYPEIRKNLINGNKKGAFKFLMRVGNVRISRKRWIRFFVALLLPSFLIRKYFNVSSKDSSLSNEGSTD